MTPEQVDDWESHWRRFADAAEANPAQEYRRRLVLAAIPGTARRVLDIGSGQGDLAKVLAESRPEATVAGLELSKEGVRIAGEKVPGATFHVVDLLSDDPLPPELLDWADAAVCSEVLEHVDEPARLLQRATACLAPGAPVVVTVPGGLRSAYDRHIGHRKHYRAHELRDLLTAAGLDVVTVRAAGFPFFNLYKLLVVLRGEKLVSDADEGRSSALLRFVSWVFRGLFRLNTTRAPWGWQLVAVARRKQPLS